MTSKRVSHRGHCTFAVGSPMLGDMRRSDYEPVQLMFKGIPKRTRSLTARQAIMPSKNTCKLWDGMNCHPCDRNKPAKAGVPATCQLEPNRLMALADRRIAAGCVSACRASRIAVE